jgi:nitrous oxide reductase accessory protein NosL
MKTKFRFAIAALLVALLAASCSKMDKPRADKDPGHKCALCNMKVKLPENKLGARIVFKDGREEYYCEMGHALMGWRIETVDEPDPANPPVAFHAVDYLNEGIIDARKASYVVGSDVESAMFTMSVVAFENHEAARRFAEEHGGGVYLFDLEALQPFPVEHKNDPLPDGVLTEHGGLSVSKWKKQGADKGGEMEHGGGAHEH